MSGDIHMHIGEAHGRLRGAQGQHGDQRDQSVGPPHVCGAWNEGSEAEHLMPESRAMGMGGDSQGTAVGHGRWQSPMHGGACTSPAWASAVHADC